jgi:hypothetical protein
LVSEIIPSEAAIAEPIADIISVKGLLILRIPIEIVLFRDKHF